jgi:predicted ArsR family transcriptional regulator
MAEEFEEQVVGVAALADPARRRLYEHVVGASDSVSRDQAAVAVGIKRALAAFHLDKLVDAGLLAVEYRRLTGRTGPGAGRPSKLYRRSEREFDVSLPPREYDLGGQVLAAGVERAVATGDDVLACVRTAAFERGKQLAAPGDHDGVGSLVDALTAHGYEPRVSDDQVLLANCPFHALAREHTQLVCGMNLSLCKGLASAVDLHASGLEPQLQPEDGRCCVVFASPQR